VNLVFFIIAHSKLVNHSTFKWTNFGEAYTSATGQAILLQMHLLAAVLLYSFWATVNDIAKCLSILP